MAGPGSGAANALAACIADWIDPFMLLDESIRRTVPIPDAEAEERTLRFLTGLPSSVTFTSSVVSTTFWLDGSVRTYARSGKSALPASTTCTVLASAPAAESASETRRESDEQAAQ